MMKERDTEDSRPGESPARLSADAQAFANFLKHLDADPDAAGREYARLRRKLLGFFSLRGDTDPDSGADETLDRTAAKLAAGAVVPEIGPYALGIARFVSLERNRLTQRERQAFIGFTENRGAAFDERAEQVYRLMAHCLEQLPPREQELLTAYCQDLRGLAQAEQRQQLAEVWGTTAMALRLRVHRLRLRLADCVKKTK